MCDSYRVVSFVCAVRLTFHNGKQNGTNRTLQQVGSISANILKIINIKESYTLFRSSKCVICRSASPTRGMQWHSWLSYCATSRKDLCSIGIFYSHNTSGCTMARGSTQPLTEMSTRNISWGVKTAST